ncbi:MAG: hypothetical protein ABIH40_05330 [Candidatus Omnitrophota bacterium]
MAVEKAIFISKVKNLNYVTAEYSRLYFGIEFCQNLIPSVEDLEYILRFVSEKGMDFTFVSPYVTNAGMERLKLLSDYLIERRPESEIVINDWGFMRWLNRNHSGINLVLGRLLTKQKRGPRILRLIGKVPGDMIEHFCQSIVDSEATSSYLIDRGIKRIELDNLLQGVSRPSPLLKGSLYFPFAYVTTTRFCLISSYRDRIDKPLRSIFPCNRECQNYTFKLTHKQMPVELFLKGNTQFFRNDKLPEEQESLNIDRIVYEPEMPV